MSRQPSRPDSKKALLEAFDEVIKTHQDGQANAPTAGRRGSGRPGVWGLAFVVLLAAAYLWFERPQWLFPAPPRAESTVMREASLRIALANAARHVEHFRRTKGRLPTHLDETGTMGTAIVYEPQGASAYTLRGTSGPVSLTLKSSDSLRPFVGNSFEILSRRAR